MRRWLLTGTALLLLALAAPAAVPSKRPSVLVVTLDTTRADRLGCYGGQGGLTPFLDQFAATSFRFKHCETPVPETVPAHLSLFSGWYPDRHGLRKNLEVMVSPRVPLLAEEFKAAGFETAAFVSAFVLAGNYGMARGFQLFEDGFYDPKNPSTVERKAEEALALAKSWLLDAQGPWFCWIHLYDPHIPYDPPPPFATAHKGRPYDGELAYMDASLGKFFKEVAHAGKLTNAIVVLCGDHGESLGEHGEDTHGVFLYEATTWVPLLMRLPGQEKGAVLDPTVSLVDVAPTLRSLCALPEVSGDGRSLESLLNGGRLDRAPVYLEALTGLYAYGWAPLYALVDGPDKFILAPRRERYRLDRDPTERDNLFRGDARSADLEKALKARLAKAKPESTEARKLDDEELRSLRSLGYISGTAGVSGGSYRDPKDGIGLMKEHTAALELLQSGQRKQAAAAFEGLLRKDPNNPLFHYYLGNAFEEENPDRALACYKKAIQHRRDFPQAYVRLLYLLESVGRQREAFDVATLALQQVDDMDGQIRSLQAWAAFEMGRPAGEVEALLEPVRAAGRENTYSLKLRALLKLKAGERLEALAILERMAAVSPDSDVATLGSDARFKDLKEEPRFWRIVIAAQKRVQGRGPASAR